MRQLPSKCLLCDFVPVSWTSLRIHASRIHNLSSNELYDALYDKKICACGNSLKFISLTHGYRESCTKCVRCASLKKASDALRGKPAWNHGLTKEDDSRVRTISNSLKEHYSTQDHHTAGTKLSQAHKDKITKGLLEHYSENDHWSAGLSIDTDDRIRARGIAIAAAFANGAYHPMNDKNRCNVIKEKISKSRKELYNTGKLARMHGAAGWNCGLTKETCESIKLGAEKTSIAIKKRFDEGSLKTWCDGKTKETDDTVAAMALTLKNRYKSGELVQWSKGLTKETDARLKKHSEEKRLSVDQLIMIFAGAADKFTCLSNFDEYTGYAHKLEFECVDCKHKQQKSVQQLVVGTSCIACGKHSSVPQRIVTDWIKQIYKDDIIVGNRSMIAPYELDVYLPLKKFAVEVNGIYYHSEEMGSTSTYHQNKTDKCAARDIKLMHIFEDEVYYKLDIIKSMLAIRVHAKDLLTFKHARKLQLKIVDDHKQARLFFDENHLDGYAQCSLCVGLWDNEKAQWLCMASFRKPFHKKYSIDSIELARLCSMQYHIIRGGASRMIKFAINVINKRWEHAKFLMTYHDCRFGADSAYSKIGFKLIRDTIPRFWWTDFVIRYNRFKIRAQNGKSEKDVAKEVGMTKIWGCKNKLYTLEIK